MKLYSFKEIICIYVYGCLYTYEYEYIKLFQPITVIVTDLRISLPEYYMVLVTSRLAVCQLEMYQTVRRSWNTVLSLQYLYRDELWNGSTLKNTEIQKIEYGYLKIVNGSKRILNGYMALHSIYLRKSIKQLITSSCLGQNTIWYLLE